MLLSATRSNNTTAVLSAHCMQRYYARRRPRREREYCMEKRSRSDLMGRLLAGAAGFAFGAAASGGLHRSLGAAFRHAAPHTAGIAAMPHRTFPCLGVYASMLRRMQSRTTQGYGHGDGCSRAAMANDHSCPLCSTAEKKSHFILHIVLCIFCFELSQYRDAEVHQCAAALIHNRQGPTNICHPHRLSTYVFTPCMR